MAESRTSKSIKNARVALFYYFAQLILGFFSRKAFFDYLGSEILGLNTTASNLLGFLNLAELGVSASVSFFLYQPLYDSDREKLSKLVSLQGWIYRRVAWVIIICSIGLMGFFPQIFGKSPLPLVYAYSTYAVLLFSALLGYFVNYKQIILFADQKGYKVQEYTQGIGILKTVAQILCITYTPWPFVAWLVIEALGATVSAMAISWILKKEYPWLKTRVKRGRLYLKEFPEVLKKTGQVFFHKIGTVVLTQSSPLVIYGFTSLTTVALYGNYIVVVSKIGTLIGTMFTSTGAAVGNLVASHDKERIVRVFWELYDSRMCLATIALLCLFYLTNPFIAIWLGAEYCLGKDFLLLYIAMTGINMTRSTVDSYLNAYGLFKDVWAPLAESLLNIGCSVALGYVWGLNGIIVGIIISQVCIICLWKPYFLFTQGFKDRAGAFFGPALLRLSVAAVLFAVTYVLFGWMDLDHVDTVTGWLKAAVVVSLVSFLLGGGTFMIFPGCRDFAVRIKNVVRRRF